MSQRLFGLTLAAVITSAGPVQAEFATCNLLQPASSATIANRLKCDFGLTDTSRIEYVSGECVSTNLGSFFVKQFQIVVMTAKGRIPYQLPVYKSALNAGFVNGSVTFGASQTSIRKVSGTQVYALVDIVTPFPGEPLSSNVSSCSVSMSGE